MSQKTLYLDLVGGAAGDMLLAALLNLGASIERVRANVADLGLSKVELSTCEIFPAGLRALRLDVMIDGVLGDQGVVEGSPHAVLPGVGPVRFKRWQNQVDGHRSHASIQALLQASTLPPRVKAIALDAFARLAQAESVAHGVPVAEITFHEVGSDDAIADIVGVATALDELAPERVICSPVPLGRGLTQGAHGPIPLPGPAVLSLLAGVPTLGVALDGETVTPTGAALLRAISQHFGPSPAMSIERVGVGGGHKSWPDRPNVVRAWLGQSDAPATIASDDDCLIEANLDDMSPEQLPDLERALFASGAIDVWSTAVHMKKGRMGVLVSALARRSQKDVLVSAFLVHSTTLGVRVLPVERYRTDRRSEEVDTPYGRVRVKVALRPGGPVLVTPEHDDCARLADERGQPVRAVYEAALRAAWAHFGSP